MKRNMVGVDLAIDDVGRSDTLLVAMLDTRNRFPASVPWIQFGENSLLAGTRSTMPRPWRACLGARKPLEGFWVFPHGPMVDWKLWTWLEWMVLWRDIDEKPSTREFYMMINGGSRYLPAYKASSGWYQFHTKRPTGRS